MARLKKTFPLDSVVEILSKLPVKSLVRFRCVSKSWDSTITDPVFSKLHQSRPGLFFSLYGNGPFRFSFLSSDALLADSCDDINGAVTHVPSPWGSVADNRCNIFVLGCCHGLVCVYNKSACESVLWNPSTRKFKALPPLMRFEDNFFYGFGYDQVTDDYKVVIGLIHDDADDSLTVTGDNVFVFSLKSGAWRSLANSSICPSVPSDTDSRGVHLGGALHWLGAFGEGLIIAFDLANETYEVLPYPEIGLYGHSTDLCVLGEHLCLCSKTEYGKGVDVWIMKEYGVKSSWTKVFHVPHETLDSYSCNYNFAPILFTKEDELVATVHGFGAGVSVVRCNTIDLRWFKDLMLWPYANPDCTLAYRESLVSPLVSHQA